MATKEVPCNSCGKPAIVHISNMIRGKRVALNLCTVCADRRARSGGEPGQRFRLRLTRTDMGGILISVGLFVFAVSSLADLLKFGSGEGFGWKQEAGLALAGMLALTGSVFGVLMLIVIGVVIGTLTLLADLLAFGSNAGFGIQQLIGSLIGLAVMMAGLRIVSRTSRRVTEPVSAADSGSPEEST